MIINQLHNEIHLYSSNGLGKLGLNQLCSAGSVHWEYRRFCSSKLMSGGHNTTETLLIIKGKRLLRGLGLIYTELCNIKRKAR